MGDTAAGKLNVEVAEDESFERVVATTATQVSAASDWTCRVLVGGLKPAHVYWYRFTDGEGNGSRVGRTITAPAVDDARPVRFVFVSCQNANHGAQNAYRRMIFEDERAPEAERLGFVLHLGDFIYEIVWYPEDRPQGMYDRRFRDLVRYPHGEKIRDFHIPTTVEDYRAVYRAYLNDPDLQDARARWPFVNMWDNHEFSWLGWQSLCRNSKERRDRRRLAKWRPIRRFSNTSRREWRDRVERTRWSDSIRHTSSMRRSRRFDEHGLGQEPNNLAALAQPEGLSGLALGPQRGTDRDRPAQLSVRRTRGSRKRPSHLASDDFPEMIPEEAMEILDAGRTYNGGQPPASIRFGRVEIANFSKDRPAQTILGAEQKAWFLERLRDSKATWKIWGNTTATLDMRADPQNLPAGITKPWPGAGYAGFRWRRSQHRLRRARRDIRFRSSARNHRLRHRGWRSP